MSRIDVPNQSIGYVAAFCSLPIFLACYVFLDASYSLAIATAFAVMFVATASSWKLRSATWFWPLIAACLVTTVSIHLLFVSLFTRLTEGYSYVVCIAGAFIEFMLILKVIERFERNHADKLH